MRNLLLAVLLAVGVVGCTDPAFEACFDGKKHIVNRSRSSNKLITIDEMIGKDGKPIPCPKAK